MRRKTFLQERLTARLGRLPSIPKSDKNIRVGIVFSGGPAPGAHTICYSLAKALPRAVLVGFLQGPKGLLEGKTKELSMEELTFFASCGGFDLLGTGRKKIASKEELSQVAIIVEKEKLDALLIIGGDDSATTAEMIHDHFQQIGSRCQILALPKTIDGDLGHAQLPLSFGFDTACGLYSQMIHNLLVDARSVHKYWHFVRLMGRNASHVTLECALRTQPQFTIITEEVAHKKISLETIIEKICDVILLRAKSGRNYGVLLIPEGIVDLIESFTMEKSHVDSYGNAALSAISAENFFIDLCRKRLMERVPEYAFQAVPHFFGYEGRCSQPSPFDLLYCDHLGHAAAISILEGESGVMVTIPNLQKDPSEWKKGSIPLKSMLKEEMRNGKTVKVVGKKLVDLEGKAFAYYKEKRTSWGMGDGTESGFYFDYDEKISQLYPHILRLL